MFLRENIRTQGYAARLTQGRILSFYAIFWRTFMRLRCSHDEYLEMFYVFEVFGDPDDPGDPGANPPQMQVC